MMLSAHLQVRIGYRGYIPTCDPLNMPKHLNHGKPFHAPAVKGQDTHASASDSRQLQGNPDLLVLPCVQKTRHGIRQAASITKLALLTIIGDNKWGSSSHHPQALKDGRPRSFSCVGECRKIKAAHWNKPAVGRKRKRKQAADTEVSGSSTP